MRRLVLLATLLVLAFSPATAQALEFKIVNQSSQPADKVFVTVAGSDTGYDVPGIPNNSPVTLASIPGQKFTVNKLVSGRVYISYGKGVNLSVPFTSPTRFDWAELTVIPSSSDVANLTAVDQFGIGMRLATFNGSGQKLETLGSANSNTVFDALQKIPGGPGATIRNSNGKIIRVLSPNKSDTYPKLGQYVKSMSGKQIWLRTPFYGNPFTTSAYSGTFQADGSISLSGQSNPPGAAPSTLEFPGSQIIDDIYTGGNTPNNLSGAIYRDLLAGFSTGLWGGKYGNNALSFCSNPFTDSQGSWCPNGFNKPAFGDARKSLSDYPTCEQYAAVINRYSDSYGNPYSDASKKVTVSLNQPGTGGSVSTLQLTVLPDSGNAGPSEGGNANCGAAPKPAVKKVSFYKQAKLRNGSAKVGKATCSTACGQIKVIAKSNGKQVGYRKYKATGKNPYLTMKVTKAGRKAFKRQKKIKVKVQVWIKPSGGNQFKKSHSLKFVK
ncbi:MAG: hypothetical protein KDB57_06170 [Solirubrobacterales bacterium]|nr:hypothetical protein [Solirubrobacterales bacterium]